MTPEGEPPIKDARQFFQWECNESQSVSARDGCEVLPLQTSFENLFTEPSTNLLCRRPVKFEKSNFNSSCDSTAGELNPDWEEWLMCFPIGWTDIDTPWNRMYWLNPSHDPASEGWISRTTDVKKNRAQRVKAIGKAQYPPTASIMFDWGVAVIDKFTKMRAGR